MAGYVLCASGSGQVAAPLLRAAAFRPQEGMPMRRPARGFS